MQNAPSIIESNLPNNDPLTIPVVQELMGTIQKQQHEIEQLKHRLDLLLKRIYGPRADKIDPNQKLLFEEQTPEPVPAPPEPEPEPEYKLVKPLKKGHGRKFLPLNLRREIVVVDVTDAEKVSSVEPGFTLAKRSLKSWITRLPPYSFEERCDPSMWCDLQSCLNAWWLLIYHPKRCRNAKQHRVWLQM